MTQMTATPAPTADLADAQAFVLHEVACSDCDMNQDETHTFGRMCFGCGTFGCDCVLAEDAHADDLFWCDDCRPHCMCRDCE